MEPFTQLTAVAAPFDMANIDTDKIIPARFLRKLRVGEAGYGPWLFYDMRFDADGRERPEFILNQRPWRNTGVIVAGNLAFKQNATSVGDLGLEAARAWLVAQGSSGAPLLLPPGPTC